MSEEEKDAQAGGAGGEEPMAVEEESEDIEAFLASLEEGGAPEPDASPRAEAASEPDPFADAFAALADDHADEVDAELEAKYAALEAATPRPAPRPEARPAARPEKEPAPRAEVSAPEVEASAPDRSPEPEPEQALEKKQEPEKTTRPAPVETVRSPGFRFVVASARAVALFAPAVCFFWLMGAHLSQWIRTGWLIALLAAAVAFCLPVAARFGTGKGSASWWTFGVGLLGCVALIAPMSRLTAERASEYGHWPASAVGQLAGWSPNGVAVRASSSVSGLAASGLDAIRPSEQPLTGPLALGSREDLAKYAAALEAEAAKAAEAAPEKEKEGGEGASEKPAEKPEGAGAQEKPEGATSE